MEIEDIHFFLVNFCTFKGGVRIFNIWTISPGAIGIGEKYIKKKYLKAFQKIRLNVFQVWNLLHLGVPDNQILLHFGVPDNQVLLRFGVPDNQILLHLGVPGNCSSGPGMAGGDIFIEPLSGTPKWSKISIFKQK